MTDQRCYHTHTHNHHQPKSSKTTHIKKYNRTRDTYMASDTVPICENKGNEHKKVWDPKCEGHKLFETTSTNDINEHSKWMKVYDCSILMEPPNPSGMSILFKGGCYISNQNADTSKTCLKHIKEKICDNKLLSLSLNTLEQKPVSNKCDADLYVQPSAELSAKLPAEPHESHESAFGTLIM